MEKKEKFTVNNYVVFKYDNKCLEGRVKGVTINGTTEIYNIFCFVTFSDLKIQSTDILSNISQEIKRKMRSSPFLEIPNKAHFPPALKNVLIVDKEWLQDNRYDFPYKINGTTVLTQFKDFIVKQALIGDINEITEVVKGFTLCFNTFFKKFLVYENEIYQLESISGDPIEYCGPVHLLRLIYFLQKEASSFIQDLQTRNIVLDYSVYLLDFMLLKYQEYF